MSTDHKDSGWRKRQIAFDKKAENARELGLDYEPRKTIQEMAQKATGATGTLLTLSLVGIKELEAFAAMVRHDERARCISHVYGQAGSDNVAERTVRAIRSGK